MTKFKTDVKLYIQDMTRDASGCTGSVRKDLVHTFNACKRREDHLTVLKGILEDTYEAVKGQLEYLESVKSNSSKGE